MTKKLLNGILFSLMVFTAINCANRGMPDGGPKDTEPPKVLKTDPENYSTNFQGRNITIYFDEYIKLKDIQKQLIISPPMNTQPEILPLGGASKRITIKIYDTLQPNITYAFNFGQSIVDNNEENPLPFYRYVFSTGDYIDSLTVSGEIWDAEKLKPETFVSVMLYEKDSTYTDSIVYKNVPKYITNTLDSTTTFTIQNVKAGTYKLIALKDLGNNNKFDQKVDKIGFREGFITVPNDSISYTLTLFKEETDFKFIRAAQMSGSRIAFGYEGDPDGMEIELLSKVPDTFRYRFSKDPKADTLYFWHRPKFTIDSAFFKVTHPRFDYEKDSIKVRLKDMYPDSLTVEVKPRGTLNFEENFSITTSTPLVKIDSSLVRLFDKDTLDVPYKTTVDSLNNELTFWFDKKESEIYNLLLMPGALTDFYDHTNDSIVHIGRTKTYDDYGNLRVYLNNAVFPVIVQLTDDKGQVLFERYATEDAPVDFNNLGPRKFFLRVVFDTNKNGQWDSGDYLEQRQAERISYFPKEIEIRVGWDNIETFVLLDQPRL